MKREGDVFFFYAFFYAAGRLIIEELRTDSLYATSSVLLRYIYLLHKRSRLSAPIRLIIIPASLVASLSALYYTLSGSFLSSWPVSSIVLFLVAYSVLMIFCLFIVYFIYSRQEVQNADNKV